MRRRIFLASAVVAAAVLIQTVPASAGTVVQTPGTAAAATECLGRSSVVRLRGPAVDGNLSSPTAYPSGSTIDAFDATMRSTSPAGVHAYPIWSNGPQSGLCLIGGDTSVALEDDATVAWADWKMTAGVVVSTPNTKVIGTNIHNVGDGVNLSDGVNGTPRNWEVRGSRVTRAHDDCIENDSMHAGIVDDNLFDGCYTFYSSTHGWDPRPDGSANVVTISNNLVHIEDMPRKHPDTAGPGHGPIWKVAPDPSFGRAPQLAVHNNIFRLSGHLAGNETYALPTFTENGQVFDYIRYTDPSRCSNNVIIWDSTDPIPPYLTNLPSCFSLTTSLTLWESAKNIWLDRHAAIGGGYQPLTTPQRVFDSQTATPVAKLVAGSDRTITIPNVGSIPKASDISALVANVTIVSPSASTTLTAWGTGSKPSVVTASAPAGVTRSGHATIAPGAEPGSPATARPTVSLSLGTGNAHVIVDIVGYYRAAPSTAGDLFEPSAPTRIANSQTGLGFPNRFGANVNRFLPTSGAGSPVPATATAVVVNLTAVAPSQATELKAYATGGAVPVPSVVTAPAAGVVSNLAVVRIGSQSGVRGISVKNASSAATTDVIVDVVGWFVPASASTGLRFQPVAPSRIGATVINAGATASFNQPGPFWPRPSALSLTVSAQASGATFLTVYPGSGTMPSLPNFLAPANQGTSGAAIVVPDVKTFRVTTSGPSTLTLVDVDGFFARNPISRTYDLPLET